MPGRTRSSQKLASKQAILRSLTFVPPLMLYPTQEQHQEAQRIPLEAWKSTRLWRTQQAPQAPGKASRAQRQDLALRTFSWSNQTLAIGRKLLIRHIFWPLTLTLLRHWKRSIQRKRTSSILKRKRASDGFFKRVGSRMGFSNSQTCLASESSTPLSNPHPNAILRIKKQKKRNPLRGTQFFLYLFGHLCTSGTRIRQSKSLAGFVQGKRHPEGDSSRRQEQ